MEIKAKVDIVVADQLYEFNRSLFGIDEMLEEEIAKHAEEAAKKLVKSL